MSLSQQQAVKSATLPIPFAAPSQPGPLVTVRVGATPQKKEAMNGDIVLLGFVQQSEVEVVFKRENALVPLLTHLVDLVQSARTRSKATGKPMPHVSSLRCPIEIEGAWKVRLQVDEDEIPTRRYQLVVNRWRMVKTAAPAGHKPQVAVAK